MKSAKKRLVMGIAAVGLLCAAPAIATVLAYRMTTLNCISRSANFRINTPSGVPGMPGVLGADWGVASTDAVNDMTIYCPMQMDAATSNTAVNERVNSVTMLFSSTSDVKCSYNLIEYGGGVLSSIDMSGNSTNIMTDLTVTTAAPAGYQMATPNLNRQFFVCTLPKANQTVPITSSALLKALEVNYGVP
jgi:hypothetical protein